MDIHTAAAICYGDRRIAAPETERERRERITENLCDALDSAKLILGDRRFTFRERLDALALTLDEIREEVERIEISNHAGGPRVAGLREK